MKGIDIFCASPASTAICSSTEHRSMVRGDATRPIDHHHHRHRHHHHHNVPCSSSRLPILPRSFSEKNRKSSSSKKTIPDLQRKSSADIRDLSSLHGCSSRYLLSDSAFIDWFADDSSDEPVSDHQFQSLKVRSHHHHHHGVKSSLVVPSSQPVKTPRQLMSLNKDHSQSHDSTKSSAALVLKSKSGRDLSQQSLNCHSPALHKSSSSARSREQVVVLRVSIHCKGCEGKIRKHISKMEGVKSFSIDLASKKVIIKGDVTPLGVLSSVSKVKNAQLWPSPTSSSSSSSSSTSSPSSS